MVSHMIAKFPEHRCQIYLFTVVGGSKAGVDVALIKPSLLSCVNKVALFLCKLLFFLHNCIRLEKKFASKQGHPQPCFHTNARVPSAQL